MNYKDILKFLDAVPFVPFRIHITNGQTYFVPHRDFVWVEPNRLQVAKPSKESGRFMERTEYVSLLHIVSIEPVPQAA
jgi:hypothetical protein